MLNIEPVAKKPALEPVPEDNTVPTGFEPAKPKPTPTQQIEAARTEERQTAENRFLKLTELAATAYSGNFVEARVRMAKRVGKAFEEIKREAEFEKAAGNTKAYMALINKHRVYTNTAETILDVVIKHPVDRV